MMDVFRRFAAPLAAGLTLAAVAGAQEPQHGRKYKAPPPLAHVVVTVEKGFNEKPLMNAAVIFHAVRDGKSDANLEVKTDPDGKATIDLLEVGSHVTLQVIASGFATYATEFDLSGDTKELTVKMQRPRSQVSEYGGSAEKLAPEKPGVQEHIVSKPVSGATGSTAPAVTPTTAPAGPPQ